jgi:predicted DNA-binding ribbon-helix-helix protein
MCRIYVNADPILYESRTRALRIHGVVTTVRLENLFWDVLQEVANRENVTTSQFVVKLYDELLALRGEVPANFASFLRVCCLRYLSLNGTGKEDAEDGEADSNFHPRVVQSS